MAFLVLKQFKENTRSIFKVATFFFSILRYNYLHVTKDKILEMVQTICVSLPAIFVSPNDNSEILYKIKISASGKKVV